MPNQGVKPRWIMFCTGDYVIVAKLEEVISSSLRIYTYITTKNMKKESLNRVIKSPTPVNEKDGLTFFLAGPMKGAPKWQRTVPKLAEELGISGVTFLNPYHCQRWVSWKAQVDWESAGLRLCDIALFWIPNQETEVEGRDYAQTTRMELLENLALGKRVILGIDTDIRAADYMRYKASHYGVKHIHKTLEGCLKELKEEISKA